MELVELLYDPDYPNDASLQAKVVIIAEVLGIRPIDAAVILSQRHPNP